MKYVKHITAIRLVSWAMVVAIAAVWFREMNTVQAHLVGVYIGAGIPMIFRLVRGMYLSLSGQVPELECPNCKRQSAMILTRNGVACMHCGNIRNW